MATLTRPLMRSIACLLGLAACITALRPVHIAAQTPEHQAAYRAIRASPVGALPPVMTSTIAGFAQGSAQLALRGGYSPGDHGQSVSNNYAATGIFPIDLGSTLSFTGGMRAPTCAGCDRSLMLAIGADRRLGAFGLGETAFPLRFTFGVQGELGYARPETGTAFSGYFGVPIATVIGGPSSDVVAGRGYRFMGFATPGIAWAQELAPPEVGGDAMTGYRFLLGAGVGIFNPAANVMINAGVQQIAIDPSEPQFGLVVTLGGR